MMFLHENVGAFCGDHFYLLLFPSLPRAVQMTAGCLPHVHTDFPHGGLEQLQQALENTAR